MTYRSSWCANQHVLAGLVPDRIDQALHAIECLVTFKSTSTKAVEGRDIHKLLTGA